MEIDSRRLLQNILTQGSYWVVNKALVKELGLVESNVLSYLVDKYNSHGDWFYCTADIIYNELNIGRRPYDNAISKLKSLGIIDTKLSGIPPKVHFHINGDLIIDIIIRHSV